jgi:hypothetical protein
MMALPYRPLTGGRAIRVLQLHPAQHSTDPLCGSLQMTSLENPILYSAISYQWGPVDPSLAITVDGCTIRVTQNCYDALLRLRKPKNSRPLWIDAICINQLDIIEKSSQVGMMTDVYLEADEVIVWLGESTEETDYV